MRSSKPKIIRVTTVPISLNILLKGQLKFMNENGFDIIGVSSSGAELQDVKNREGVQVIPLEMTRAITPLRDLKSLWQFYRICKTEKPLIVHSHTPKAGIIGMLGAFLAGVPYRLHTVAGLPLMETSGPKRLLLEIIEKIIYKCATRIYPNSGSLKDFILNENYVEGSKVKVIAGGSSNGIDTNWFSIKKIKNIDLDNFRLNLGIKSSDFVFVYVGRLVKDKGINELIQAFKVLSKNYNNCKLLLVGEKEAALDPLLNKTEKEIQDNKSIICVGFQDDVRPFLALSDVFVFPSYREGFPNVVMQAGAMGLACIVTDINGSNEIIKNGVNGLVVSVKSWKSILQAMEEVLNNRNLVDELSASARDNIVRNYEQIFVWEELLKEYKSQFF